MFIATCSHLDSLKLYWFLDKEVLAENVMFNCFVCLFRSVPQVLFFFQLEFIILKDIYNGH